MTKDPTGTRVMKGALWSGTNTLVMRLMNIAITAFVLRVVSPHEFGVFAVALVVFTVVQSFSEAGLSSCLVRTDMKPEEIAPTVTLLALITSTALAAMMVVFAGPLAASLGSEEAEGPIKILALSVFIGGLTTVPTSLLVRDFRQDRIFLSSVAAFVPANAVLLYLATKGEGAHAFAWSRVAGQIAASGVVFWSAGRPFWPRLDSRQVLGLLRFGLPLAGANLVGYVLLNADYDFVGRMLGPTQLGIYMLAFNVASWPTSVLGSTVNSVAMPAFSRLRANGHDLGKLLGRSVQLVALLAFPIALLCMVFARPIVLTLYGEEWLAAVPILQILSAYGGLFIISLVMSNLLVAIGKAGRLFLVQLLWLAGLIPSMVLGLRVDGVRGAAVAHLVVITFIVLPTYLIMLARYVDRPWSTVLRKILLPLLASGTAAAVALAVSKPLQGGFLGLTVGGGLGTLVYLTLTRSTFMAALPNHLAARLSLSRWDHRRQRARAGTDERTRAGTTASYRAGPTVAADPGDPVSAIREGRD